MRKTGILDDKAIHQLFKDGHIKSGKLDDNQVQPASLDLRLGKEAWRVRASFLPNRLTSVADKLDIYQLQKIDLTQDTILERNCVYIVLLQESLDLPDHIDASTNPKSSTGRLDVFTRVITDKGIQFDTINSGYSGPLYLEISPLTFPIRVREGSRLSQIRFRQGQCRLNQEDLSSLHKQEKLMSAEDILFINDSLVLSIDLSGAGDLIGYRARRHTDVIDVDKINTYLIHDFWEPIYGTDTCSLILDPDEFYILASKEAVHIPSSVAAEMIPFDNLMGEFRAHYAGFFDPGFGSTTPTKAVLEVRSHDVPFILQHTQPVARLAYEHMLTTPKNLYGQGLSSNYQGQGLKLSKHFITHTDQQHP